MREDYAFFDVSREMDPRASSGKILRVKSRYPEKFRFLGLYNRALLLRFFAFMFLGFPPRKNQALLLHFLTLKENMVIQLCTENEESAGVQLRK